MSALILRKGLSFIRSRKGRKGSTIVEFALVFILFLVILMGLMELGRGMWTYATLAHAARQAGRFCMVRGSTSPTNEAAIKVVVDKYCSGLNTSSVTLSCSWKDPDDDTVRANGAAVERGDVVQIQVGYPFQLVTGGLVLGQSTLPLAATTQMVVAN